MENQMTPIPALAADGVCHHYGQRTVLDHFSLTVGDGEFAALMGPSGSGKSTFLHLAAGLLACRTGTILVHGRDVAAMSDRAATIFRRTRIGFVFQAFNLLGDRTVRDNIILPLKLAGMREDPERYRRLTDTLGIAGLDSRSPDSLSGGERQRVAFARALICAPGIVLADEPTGNLDVRAARELCRTLRELNEREHTATLVVTHDPVVAAAATKVHLLKEGRIAATHDTCGDPARISRLYLETFA